MSASGQTAHEVAWRSDCPVASALDVFGDRWSLLVIRDLLLHGSRTYTQLLAADEAISTNILADRLKVLSGLGLIARAHPDRPARDNPWVLTDQGAALKPIILDIAAWSSAALGQHHPSINTI